MSWQIHPRNKTFLFLACVAPPCRRKLPIACGDFFTKVTGTLILLCLLFQKRSPYAFVANLFRGHEGSNLSTKNAKISFSCGSHIQAEHGRNSRCVLSYLFYLFTRVYSGYRFRQRSLKLDINFDTVGIKIDVQFLFK